MDIIYAHSNMSADLIDAAVRNGAKCLVIAGAGEGNMTPPALDRLTGVARSGIVVVRSVLLQLALTRTKDPVAIRRKLYEY